MPQYDLDVFTWLSTPARLLSKPCYLLYRCTRGSIHITVRYISKYLNRKKQINHPKDNEGSMHDVKPALEPHSLRLPMELVIMITKDLHHADLTNITRSSKYLRTAFFGADNPAQVASDLRQFACAGGAAPLASCPVCRIPTCSVRSILPKDTPSQGLSLSLTFVPFYQECRRNAPAPRHNLAFKHLTGCQAACTRCFFMNHCFRKPRPSSGSEPGAGWAGRVLRKTKAPFGGGGGSRHTSGGGFFSGSNSGVVGLGRSFSPMLEKVCHNCARLPGPVREERRDAGNLREMWRQARFPMACFACREVLSEGGVRWWVDSGTGEECKWYGHPGWVEGPGWKPAAGVGG